MKIKIWEEELREEKEQRRCYAFVLWFSFHWCDKGEASRPGVDVGIFSFFC